jgi:hypothetical protein
MGSTVSTRIERVLNRIFFNQLDPPWETMHLRPNQIARLEKWPLLFLGRPLLVWHSPYRPKTQSPDLIRTFFGSAIKSAIKPEGLLIMILASSSSSVVIALFLLVSSPCASASTRGNMDSSCEAECRRSCLKAPGHSVRLIYYGDRQAG